VFEIHVDRLRNIPTSNAGLVELDARKTPPALPLFSTVPTSHAATAGASYSPQDDRGQIIAGYRRVINGPLVALCFSCLAVGQA
jgi:hypothetical protein